MAKPKQIILTEEGVITQEALLAYAAGRLGAAESAQMEKLLANDPFAQEALEGMRDAPAKAEISTVITSLNMQLREKTGARERKKKGIEIHWANYAYAAVILGVLVGFGYVMVHILASNNNDLAENKNVPQAQESTPLIQAKKDTARTDTIVAEEKPRADNAMATIILDDTIATKDLAPTKNTTTVAAGATTLNSGNTTAAGATNTYANIPAPSAMPAKKDDQSTAKSKSAVPAMAEASDKGTNDKLKKEGAKTAPAAERKTPDKKDGDVVSAQLLSAKSYFDSGDYINAEKKYKEVLTKMPGNLDALYFGGVSSYLNGTWGLGETNFDKLIKSGAYTDGSKWYKANILIAKGQKDEAKKLLRDIINSGSIYKERAVKRYEELLK